MHSPEREPLTFSPSFDLETYMLMAGYKRIQSGEAQRLEQDWLKMHRLLKGYRLKARRSYLLIYLQPELEGEVDAAAVGDPERSEELETMARSLIMVSFLEKVPQAGLGSCAPVPEPDTRLRRALKPLGLDLDKTGRLNVRYGMITRLPFTDDCGGCFIRSSCAKRILTQG